MQALVQTERDITDANEALDYQHEEEDEHTEGLIAEAEEGTPEAFCPTDAGGVDWVLARVAAHRAEARLIRENMELMARACERKAEALEWKYGPALQTWLEAQLAAGAGNTKSPAKSKRLPHGVLGYRTKPAGVQVTDAGALLAWAKENFPAAVTEAIDRKAVAIRLLDTGEVADGALLTPSEEVFYIK